MARPTNDFNLLKKDKDRLVDFINQAGSKAREVKRAKALLLLDQEVSVKDTAKQTGFSEPTIYRLRSLYQESGLEPALKDKPRAGRPQQLHPSEKKKIIDLYHQTPPGGLKKWTLRALAEHASKLNLVSKGSISHTEVARILKERDLFA